MIEWTAAARSSEIVVQFVVDIGGTSLRIGDQLFCGSCPSPKRRACQPSTGPLIFPLGEVAVHVVDGRDPVPGRAGQAHLDPAIIKLGAVQAGRERAAQIVNAGLKIRIILPDTLYHRIDYAVERGVADGRVAIVPARMQISASAEHGAERRQNVERLIAQRDDMRLAGLHALGRNRPARGGEIYSSMWRR